MVERIIDLGGFKLVVQGDKLVADLNEAKEMVREARARLAQVVAWGVTKKDQPRFKLCMQTFFRVSPTAPAFEYDNAARTVMGNLGELNIAVQSDELQIAPVVVTAHTSDAAAYVQRSLPDAAWDLAIGPNPSTRASFYGPLFLRLGTLGPTATAAGNLIHEATHRYLGTRDWAYAVQFDMIGYEASYTAMGMAVPRPPASVNSIKAWYDMSVAEALNNADSYAGFVMHLTCT